LKEIKIDDFDRGIKIVDDTVYKKMPFSSDIDN